MKLLAVKKETVVPLLCVSHQGENDRGVGVKNIYRTKYGCGSAQN